MTELNGNGKRKRWSGSEKLRIVLSGMQTDIKVSELCRREGITAAQYYQWRDRLLSSAGAIFDRKPGEAEAIPPEEAELRRLKDVIAEITAENLELKKTR
jgi:transposase-like protein